MLKNKILIISAIVIFILFNGAIYFNYHANLLKNATLQEGR